MKQASSRRLVLALITAIALIATGVLYARHDLGSLTRTQGHCDLCSHLSGTAGSPAHTAIPGRPLLAVRLARTTVQTVLPSRRKVGIYLPRGPPVTDGLS